MSFAKGMSERWWPRWELLRWAPSTRLTRFWRFATDTVSGYMWTAAYGGYFCLIPESLDDPARRAYAAIGQRGLHCYRPAQAWTAALRVRLRSLSRPCGGALLQARFSLYLLHFKGVTPWRDQPGVLAGRGQRRLHFGQRRRLLPLVPGGEFARGLAQGRAAALDLDSRLRRDIRFQPLAGGAPELDIVVWKVNSDDRERASALAQSIFSNCAARNLHLALVQLPEPWFRSPDGAAAGAPWEAVKCLRSVLMKPEHEAWLDRIWEIIAASNVSEKEG